MTTKIKHNATSQRLTRVVTLLALVAAIFASLLTVTPTAEAQLGGSTVTIAPSKTCDGDWEWKQIGGPQAKIKHPDRQTTIAQLQGGSGVYFFAGFCNGPRVFIRFIGFPVG